MDPEKHVVCACSQPLDGDHPACFVPLPAEEPVKVRCARPITFADVLAYHRQFAADPRADRAWHAEAVLVLEQIEPYGHAPDCRWVAALKEKDHG
jgi:hypothetical protein